MSLQNVWQLTFVLLFKTSFCEQPTNENISTDAGLLIFRKMVRESYFSKGFTQHLDDRRRVPDHLQLEMVSNRVFGIPDLSVRPHTQIPTLAHLHLGKPVKE